MNARKLLAVGLAALLMSAGVGAAATSTGTGVTTAATDASVEDYDASASYDNGTVTFTVTANGSGVSGLPVAVDGDSVGDTDATGSVAFDVNASATENFTVVVSGENVTGEFTYALENSSLTLVEGGFETVEDDGEENETEDDGAGPQIGLPENASANAKAVIEVVNSYLNGEMNASSLGEAVSSVAGNAPEDAGKPDDVGPEGDEDDRGPPEDAGPEDEDDHEPPEDAGPKDDSDEETDSDDDDEDDEDDDEEDDDDSPGNSGNGNGNGDE